MENPLKVIQYRGREIEIYQDESAESPDDWGDEGLFLVGYHRQFWVTRDKFITKDLAVDIFRDDVDDENKEAIQDILNKYHVFGLEAYIHSGVVLALSNTGNFPDRQWDVSQLGLVFVSIEEWQTREEARKAAEGLIETWNQYLSGDVYGYIAGDDSCWGYYGIEHCIEEAKEAVDYQIKSELKQHFKILKGYIRNKVPLQYRRSACV